MHVKIYANYICPIYVVLVRVLLKKSKDELCSVTSLCSPAMTCGQKTNHCKLSCVAWQMGKLCSSAAANGHDFWSENQFTELCSLALANGHDLWSENQLTELCSLANDHDFSSEE